MKEFTFIDLFCGVGGFHQAMSSLGGKCLFACDIDKYCQQNYYTNYGIMPAGDITKIDAKDIPSHDVLCAGFCCQPFSKAGKRLGFEDETNGTLFFDVLRIIKYHHPKYIFLENVRNLVSHDCGNTWRVIHDSIESEGYNISNEPIICSPDMLGIPQHRERVFILAIRKDIGNLPETIEIKKIKNLTPEDILQDEDEIDQYRYHLSLNEQICIDFWNAFIEFLKSLKYPIPKFPVWLDALHSLDKTEVENTNYTWKKNFLRKNAELYENNKERLDIFLPTLCPRHLVKGSKAKLEWQADESLGLRDCFMQFRPSGLRVKNPTCFPALVAMVQTPIIGSRGRYLTPREAARLQSFPDDYILDENDNRAYKQMGNAVNVDCIKYFAEILLNV